MAGTTFQELLDGVALYYGSGSDQWAEIARYGVNQQTIPIIQQVPGVTVTMSNSGKYLGYDYNSPFATPVNPASAIDSNLQTGAYGDGSFNAQIPASAVTDQSTGTVTLQSGAVSSSTGSVVATIADRASLAVAGVALGTKLGKLIDSGLYAINPEWWDEHYPTINPQTWDDMATTQGGKNFIRSLFGLQNDDATMYLDERMLAYTYMMLLANGAYGSSDETEVPDDNIFNLPGFEFNSGMESGAYIQNKLTGGSYNYAQVYYNFYGVYAYINSNGRNISAIFAADSNQNLQWAFGVNENPFALSRYTFGSASSYTYDGRTVYFYANLSWGGIQVSNPYETNATVHNYVSQLDSNAGKVAWLMVYGGYSPTPGLDGVSQNPQASEQVNPDTLINPTTGQPVTPNDSVDDVLNALKTQYPDLFNNSVYEDIPQSDGTTERITYIPVPYPDTTNEQQPVTDTTPGIDPQTNPQVNPDTRTQELIQQLIDTLATDPTTPDTGDGDTPTAVIPTGSASALYSVYNPSQIELNSFGAWLWSSNFVDQLLKLFNDPMQAIIGLHKVFAQPVVSGTSNIKVGYLDSGVSSNVVGNQYVTIDCGYVDVTEYFGNVFDYDPFTQVYIYLPFVGIEKLDTGDVMRGRVGVKYHVDVITGACLAEISVIRDGSGGILYTFTGNCAVQYPISSGSYMGIVASLASIAGGVVGTVASGGALAPVAMGAVSGVLNAHTRVQHSGGFSGNAGAMGVKIPYLIVTRPQTCLADNFPAFDGYPANKTTLLSECSGFVKCETCHVENVPATDAELTEIEMLLKGGIII